MMEDWGLVGILAVVAFPALCFVVGFAAGHYIRKAVRRGKSRRGVR